MLAVRACDTGEETPDRTQTVHRFALHDIPVNEKVASTVAVEADDATCRNA